MRLIKFQGSAIDLQETSRVNLTLRPDRVNGLRSRALGTSTRRSGDRPHGEASKDWQEARHVNAAGHVARQAEGPSKS